MENHVITGVNQSIISASETRVGDISEYFYKNVIKNRYIFKPYGTLISPHDSKDKILSCSSIDIMIIIMIINFVVIIDFK